jgi:hypothetical protein
MIAFRVSRRRSFRLVVNSNILLVAYTPAANLSHPPDIAAVSASAVICLQGTIQEQIAAACSYFPVSFHYPKV